MRLFCVTFFPYCVHGCVSCMCLLRRVQLDILKKWNEKLLGGRQGRKKQFLGWSVSSSLSNTSWQKIAISRAVVSAAGCESA